MITAQSKNFIKNVQKKSIALVKKYHDAKEKGDEKAMQMACKALSKHRVKDQKLKEKAEEAGFYWY